METLTIQKRQEKTSGEGIFLSALRYIVADLQERSQQIIFARYGVLGSEALTLDGIGKKYQITRERVRQVIREVLKKVRDKKGDPRFLEIREAILLAIKEKGGIIEEGKLLSILGKKDACEKAAARFFLECVDGITSLEIKGELLFSYALPSFEIETWRKVIKVTVEILKNQKKAFFAEELFELVKKSQKDFEISKEEFANYLEVSEEVKQNSFKKWGIAKWKEISPKGTREKAYLILKEIGKPLHFRDIAKKIDDNKLSKKSTHPQTVHNELIKDENFVLVGRGIYALVEWGYRQGTVKDVIEEILKKTEKPLTREEILKKVLEIRQVKKSTIVINLNNYFSKEKNGFYSLKK